MTKELWICIVIVILICVGDFFTQKYTKLCINEADSELRELRRELMQENVDAEKTKTVMNELQEKWGKLKKAPPVIANEIKEKIELTDEIEKVETELAGINGYIEIEEYKEAVVEIDKNIYILEHIKNKNLFNLENIF